MRCSRRSLSGSDVDRVVAANIDVVGIVTGLDREPNLRRLERVLARAAELQAVEGERLTERLLLGRVLGVLGWQAAGGKPAPERPKP